MNRSPAKAEAAAALGGPRCAVGGIDDVEKASRLVNATSVGMGGDGLPVPVEILLGPPQSSSTSCTTRSTPRCFGPPASAALAPSTASGMLVHQGALAFALWTGVDAPIEAMNAAARLPSPPTLTRRNTLRGRAQWVDFTRERFSSPLADADTD